MARCPCCLAVRGLGLRCGLTTAAFRSWRVNRILALYRRLAALLHIVGPFLGGTPQKKTNKTENREELK